MVIYPFHADWLHVISNNELLYYLDVARLTAKRSHAVRCKVGAVLVSTDRVMAVGYNGTPAGWDNCCENVLEDGSLVTKPEVIHAEMNALFKCLNNGISTKGASMFMTLAPCIECAKAMHLANIAGVYYLDEYRSTAGADFLRRVGIPVERLISVDETTKS